MVMHFVATFDVIMNGGLHEMVMACLSLKILKSYKLAKFQPITVHCR